MLVYRKDGLVRNAGPSGGRLQAEPKKGIGRDLPKNTLGTGPPVLKEGLIGGHQWEVWTVILWSMAPVMKEVLGRGHLLAKSSIEVHCVYKAFKQVFV